MKTLTNLQYVNKRQFSKKLITYFMIIVSNFILIWHDKVLMPTNLVIDPKKIANLIECDNLYVITIKLNHKYFHLFCVKRILIRC